MKKGSFIIWGSLVILILSSMILSHKETGVIKSPEQAIEKSFVLMELFTSQGCSSCPPADELLGKYALLHDDHIIPLAFHVDYWNRLGWTDSFSNARFSQRQQDYAGKLGLQSVYTPQLIINGQEEMVGSDEQKIAASVKRQLAEKVTANIQINSTKFTGNTVHIYYTLNNMNGHESVQGALVQQEASTHIRAGENRGLKMKNYNVVRDFVSIPVKKKEGELVLTFPSAIITTGYSIVLFVQDNKSRKIADAIYSKVN